MDGDDGVRTLFAAVESSVCSDPDVSFVVAFGSQISGEATHRSDLDLAVKFADDCPDTERFEKRCLLSGTLQQEGGPFVDVSDLEGLPLDVAHDAVSGTLVCGDERAFERFRADVEARFADQREELRHQQRAVIDRIAEDGLRG